MRTWCDWEAYCTESGLSACVPGGTYLGIQIWLKSTLSASGPLAAFNTMKWLKENLRAPVMLGDVEGPQQLSGPKAAKGHTHAIVAEPGALMELERLAPQLHEAKD